MEEIQNSNKSGFIFWMKSYLWLMAFSSLLRLAEVFYFFEVLSDEKYKQVFKILSYGLVYDSTVVTGILFCILLLSFIKTINLNRLILAAFAILLVFNVFNFWHLIKFGIGYNAYTLQQANATVVSTLLSKIDLYLLLGICLLVMILVNYFLKKQNHNLYNQQKQSRLAVLGVMVLLSFWYLSFPLYYYFSLSSSSTVNELPKNGIYNFVNAIKRIYTTKDLVVDTKEVDVDEALKIVARNLTDVSGIANGKIIRSINSDTAQPKYKHVVLIIMESMGDNAFNDTISPNLYKLKNEGTYYSKCKTSGPRTQMGVASLLTGIPNITSENFYRRKGTYKIETLADYLKPLDYQCYYLHNGYLSYDDADKLLEQGGFENLMDVASFKNYSFKNEWGVDDGALFNEAITQITNTKDKKTLHVLQSLSNHEPHQVPEGFLKTHKNIKQWDKKYQAYYYADYVLGEFITKLKHTKEFENTLVFVTGDHAEAYVEKDLSYKVFHVPLIVLGGKVKHNVVNDDVWHVDVPYTILSACGYTGKTIMMGENLFKHPTHRNILSSNYNTELNLKRNDTLYRYSYEQNKEWMFKVDSSEFASAELILNKQEQNKYRKLTFAYYKVVRHYLVNGKMNR